MVETAKYDQRVLFKETSLIAYLDLTNMLHWQETLKWKFSVYDVIRQLLAISAVKEVRVYYGLNERELDKSLRFHRRMRESGAIVISKPVKWIKKEINQRLFVRPATLNQFDDSAHTKLDEFIRYLHEQRLKIEEPKCNFDVEMALDLLDAMERISGVLLFSGDSDLSEPLRRLKVRGKSIYIFGVRGMVAKEFWSICSQFIDFGKWYQGKRSENPAR